MIDYSKIYQELEKYQHNNLDIADNPPTFRQIIMRHTDPLQPDLHIHYPVVEMKLNIGKAA